MVGSGGEGILYRGSITTGSGTTLDVAVKMLHPRHQAGMEQWRSRWQDQVELLRSLQAPGVVGVRDGFVGAMPHPAGVVPDTSQTLFLVMNWVDGSSLDEWVSEHPDCSLAEKFGLLLPVAAALDRIHGGGATGGVPIIHRDVKPANMLVDADGHAVLVDFGLIRALPKGVVTTGLAGTFGYIAPETEEEGHYSPASDRFSVGAVAWFLAVGRDPRPGASVAELRADLEAAPGVAPRVVPLILAMLDRDPVRRPAPLADWCAELTNASLGTRPAGWLTATILPDRLGIPGYEDVSVIGRGGHAVVYKATQPNLRRTVALKVLSMQEFDDSARRAFERERTSVGMLSGHPNIVTVYDSGLTASGVPYLALEYVSRGSIADMIRRGEPLEWPDVLAMGVKLAGALASAHRVGVLHCDVKPENVLVSSFGEPKLSDFGIARLLGAPRTSSSGIELSILHAAPELLDGATHSEATDVYSLASTLFTMLWGAPPFSDGPGETVASLVRRILADPAPDLSARGVPGDVSAFFASAMAKRADQRPPSALAFARELQQIEADLAVPPTSIPFEADDAEVLAPRAATTRVDVPPVSPPTPPAPARDYDATHTRPRPTKRERSSTGGRRRWIVPAIGSAAVVILLASVALAWDGGGPSTHGTTTTSRVTTTSPTAPTTAPTAPSRQPAPLPGATQVIPAGLYATTVMSPRFTLDVPAGWQSLQGEAAQVVDFVPAAGPKSHLVTLMSPDAAVDPSREFPRVTPTSGNGLLPMPRDVVAWLSDHTRLASTRSAVPGPGLAYTDLRVTVKPGAGYASLCPHCVLLFGLQQASRFFALVEGNQNEVRVYSIHGQLLIATVEAPAAEFVTFAKDADRLLDGIAAP